jgi:hypothetical protein
MIIDKENNSTRGQLFACFYCGQTYMSYTQHNKCIDYEYSGKIHYPTREDLSVCYDVLISQIIKKGYTISAQFMTNLHQYLTY